MSAGKSFNAKWVLITGCSSGIGLCAALTLKARGYAVIAGVRNAKDVEALQEQGVEHVIVCDLASSQSVQHAASKAVEISGGNLFALFNNGAFGLPGAVEDLSRDALRHQFETNVFGTHELTCALLPTLLRQPSARIVQNSSILGFAAMPMRGAYNASKFALEGLSDTLRLELKSTNVEVCLIEPGPIASKFRENALREFSQHVEIGASRHEQLYQAMLKRLSKPGPSSVFTLPPEAVVKKLIHALESSRPKVRYYVTFPTYLFACLRHFLPYRMLDKICTYAGSS